jgi:hypothetical protein
MACSCGVERERQTERERQRERERDYEAHTRMKPACTGQVYWCTGVMVYWCTEVLVYLCISVLCTVHCVECSVQCTTWLIYLPRVALRKRRLRDDQHVVAQRQHHRQLVARFQKVGGAPLEPRLSWMLLVL